MITADEYQQQCAKFDNHCDAWREDAATFGLTAEGAEAFIAAIGLIASIGKVSNRAERQLRRSSAAFDFEALKLELGDVLWNVARLSAEAGWTMSEVMQANIDKLTARYAARDCSCLLDTGSEPVDGKHWEACNSWRWYHPEFNMTGGDA